jgi:iron complex outermembrane receptor protein
LPATANSTNTEALLGEITLQKFRALNAPVASLLILGLTQPAHVAAQALEEMVVTARKKEESLQDVPLSITAFSAEQLQQAGASNNDDIAALTVNFNTVRQVGRRLDRPTIRGQASAATGVEPNASYFIDGAFVAGSISTATLGPVERVEILRGPQSAQFGRATFAGAVNYVTRRPTNEFASEVQVKGGSNDTREISGWLSGPVVEDNLYYFLAGGVNKYGGEWNNSLPADAAPLGNFIDPPQGADSSDLGGTDTKDIVGKLLWTPTDAAEITFKLGYTKGDDDHYVQLIQEPGELNCYLPIPRNDTEENQSWFNTSGGTYCGTIDVDNVRYKRANPFNPANPNFNSAQYPYLPNSANLIPNLPVNGGSRQSRFNLPDFYNGMQAPDFSGVIPGTTPDDWIADPTDPGTKRDQYRGLIQYDQGVGDWDVKTRLAYNKDELKQAFDLDRTEQRFFGGTFEMDSKEDTEDLSVEVRADSPVDQRLRGSIGVYYYDQNWESQQKQFVGRGFGNFTDPTRKDITNKAVFGSLEYDLAERWTVSTEIRYANDKKDISAPIACGDDPDTPGLEGERVEDRTDSDALTPRFTLRWEPTDLTMLYALVAKGNKPAEFNNGFFRTATADACESIVAIEEGATQIEEEKAWTYETGGKTSWLDNRLTTNLSLFYIKWENQSVFQTALIGGNPSQIIRNAGKSEIKGLELETAFAITDNLTGSFAYGLADGEYKSYNDPFYARTTGKGMVEQPDGSYVLDDNANNVRGNQLPNSPKHSMVSSLSYRRGLTAELDWFARTDYMLDSKRQTSADNFTQIDRRKMWNFRGGLDRPEWTLTGYVTNILDEQTPTSVFDFPYLAGLNWATGTSVEGKSLAPTPGRNYGLELLYRFGEF